MKKIIKKVLKIKIAAASVIALLIGYYAGTIAHDGDYLDIHWSAGL